MVRLLAVPSWEVILTHSCRFVRASQDLEPRETLLRDLERRIAGRLMIRNGTREPARAGLRSSQRAGVGSFKGKGRTRLW